ncbi:hypothetical protein QIT82_gp21 [Pseudomonas phage psageK9]|uniref:Restriction alleviation protein, Lar family n=2 Tax=Readingvirus TaxID=3152626 RepID=A0AAE8XN27_9CAUD|nr:hypothetical protein [Pseudomonas syringae]YP_010773136.1 putative transpeptidase family protein [Pseudomonas phage MR15]YP_010773227.1 hypothetical protein QIT82_gp21 [Pseudomonas phage psageK9]QJD55086.1 putative L,D-transpeptidase family protein [Pseudomonas phage MR13]QXV71601.1 hypothetical protein psageB2_024c [Pseudomonas phage psageB2]MDG6423772.1 hypothetical protein [Pseudomonas syringae pv. actinidiae]MDG6439153.1 hypothetical protein [Pseudomonas syringae pv. actinidiae]QJD552
MTNNKPNDVRVSRDLLPCPYCGRAARYVAEDYVDNSGQPWPFAECDACNTGAPVEFWNKRAQPADQQGEPVAWVECSPAWLKSGGDCATASRMCVGRHGISHLHPAHVQPATAKVVLPERMKTRPFQTVDRGSPSAVSAWNACLDEVAKLNTPQ